MSPFRPKNLTPEERVMWLTASDSPTVPSFYVNELLRTIQELRDAQVHPASPDRS